MFRYPFIRCCCPVCGRPLEVREEYLGRNVACSHCGGEFTARDESDTKSSRWSVPGSLMERADRLLALTSQQLSRRAALASQ
ncbi:MAG: hypothetical protein GX621_08930 [Pirellulaceae bacterium]|nr:hypothetical protein [Pirellulaceae bacterium]